MKNNHKSEINVEKWPGKLLILNHEHKKNESLQLKQYPWKVTLRDFILSKVGTLQPAALLKNELCH